MDQSEVERLVAELEVAVERLRSLFDQYFMGIEKLEPTVAHKDLERRIHALRKEQIRNTAQRFRFHMVLQRYNTFQTHWQRICREIERGTYRRHLLRAEQRFGRRSSAPPPAPDSADEAPTVPKLAAFDLGASLESLDVDLARDFAPRIPSLWMARPRAPDAPPLRPLPPCPPHPAVPPGLTMPPAVARPAVQPMGDRPPVANSGWGSVSGAPARPAARRVLPPGGPPQGATSSLAAAPPLTPRGTSPPGALPAPTGAPATDLSETRLRALYAQFVDTRKRLGETTADITFDVVARSVRNSVAKLKKQHGRAIDFEVTVKDGRTVLRPLLK